MPRAIAVSTDIDGLGLDLHVDAISLDERFLYAGAQFLKVGAKIYDVVSRAAVKRLMHLGDALHAGIGPQELVTDKIVVGFPSLHPQDAGDEREVVVYPVIQLVEQLGLPPFGSLTLRNIKEKLHHTGIGHAGDADFVPLIHSAGLKFETCWLAGSQHAVAELEPVRPFSRAVAELCPNGLRSYAEHVLKRRIKFEDRIIREPILGVPNGFTHSEAFGHVFQ
jgi:hypothetical protein